MTQSSEFCSSCGARQQGVGKFCSSCGAALNLPGAIAPSPPPAEPDRSEPSSSPIDRTRLWWIGGAAAIVVAAVVGIVLAMTGGDAPASTASTGDLISGISTTAPSQALNTTVPGAFNPFDGRATGAAGPEAAVQELIDSIRLKDPLGILAIIAPPERKALADTYSILVSSAEDQGLISSESGVLAAVEVEDSTPTMSVVELAGGLSYVSLPGYELTMWMQQQDAVGNIAGVEHEGGDDPIRLADLYFSEWGGSGSGLAVVEIEGAWYVSPLYTVAEWTMLDMDLPPAHVIAGVGTGTVHETPEDAVDAFLSALSSQSLGGLIDSVTPYEARLIATYERSLGAEILYELNSFYMNASVGDSRVIDEQDGIALVEAIGWHLEYSWYDSYGDGSGRIDSDGTCTLWESDWDSVRFCGNDPTTWQVYRLDTLDLAAALVERGWSGPRFVTVGSSEDGWRVSVIETARILALPLAEEPLAVLLKFLWADYYGEGAARLAWDLTESTPAIGSTGRADMELIGAGRFGVTRARLEQPTSIEFSTTAENGCEVVAYAIGEDAYRYSVDWGDCRGSSMALAPGDYVLIAATESGVGRIGPVSVVTAITSGPVSGGATTTTEAPTTTSGG